MSDKHYWFTPPDLMARLQDRFKFDYDASPPRPEGLHELDLLGGNWPGKVVWLNPPFRGMTKWIRRAINESKQGKKIVVAVPVLSGVHELVAAGARFESLGRVAWLAIEDGTPSPAPNYCVLAVLDSKQAGSESR